MSNFNRLRLRHYDYRSNGYYFITFVTQQRMELLKGREWILEALFKDVVSPIRGVAIDTLVVTPNHVHVIVVIDNSTMHLGEVIRRFKAKSSYLFKERLWQSNYYEHVIRDERALHRIREYIMNNPAMEIMKFDHSINLVHSDKSAGYQLK
ncbi:MAG: transposase [Candidatus Kerfeldbacteria bacterium]